VDVTGEIGESRAFSAGLMGETALALGVEEGTAVLADPHEVTLLDLIRLADGEEAELADRVSVLAMCRGAEPETRRHRGPRQLRSSSGVRVVSDSAWTRLANSAASAS
jgi:hypothetical protein